MEVTWDSEKIDIDLPMGSFTLGSLKSYLSSKTGVPPIQMKLYHKGGLMRDDNAPLSSYHDDRQDDIDSSRGQSDGLFSRHMFWGTFLSGLKKNQRQPMKIRMVGSRESRAVVTDRPDLQGNDDLVVVLDPSTSYHHEPLPVLDESGITSLIRELTQSAIDKCLPRVEELERQKIPQSSDQATEVANVDSQSAVKPVKSVNDEFVFLSENLLQSLLKLDGVQIESDWSEARVARKEGVRAVQGLLDRLDGLKSTDLPV
ncbi:hypothetical protein PPACK8108_LOCUS1625 [Phakopsora pachyrhizi]|uniref:BAG domain-containing protein n=1 Tax=Phakopsora pachyrhizi TaxID=170000 RepID=A0AAV0AGU3_PHAPC|nr:hypothetical protein PPACK8108_LOCUS1625 [Phakopsora pachyrhizi]